MTPPGSRARLPNRRLNLTEVIVWEGQSLLVSVGFDQAGCVVEVFADGYRTGAMLEGVLDDACILISLMLQQGIAPTDIDARLSAPGRPPQTLGGVLARHLVALQDDCAAPVRDAYRAAAGLPITGE